MPAHLHGPIPAQLVWMTGGCDRCRLRRIHVLGTAASLRWNDQTQRQALGSSLGICQAETQVQNKTG
jgi:hypothetical protein